MSAPTISKKQQTKALSAKKVKKQTIKNVLMKPFDNYWPEVSPEDFVKLIETLEINLVRIKLEKSPVPYKAIKEIPKNERRSFRQKFTNQVPIGDLKNENSGLIFGVNDVSRLLEQREAASVLVESSVKPRLLVQHVLDQAVLNNVPILVVPELKKTLALKSGIPSTTVALKKGFSPESKLNIIHKCISKISKRYPVPENHINYQRRLDLSGNSQSSSNITEEDGQEGASKSRDDDCVETVHLHLKRQSKKERVFVPELSKNVEEIGEDRMQVDSNGFIAFSNQTDKVQATGKSKKYKSLVVKRLKGDPNRQQRKIADNVKRKLKEKERKSKRRSQKRLDNK